MTLYLASIPSLQNENVDPICDPTEGRLRQQSFAEVQELMKRMLNLDVGHGFC